MSGIEKLLPLLEEGTNAKKIPWQQYGQHGVAVSIGYNTVVMDWDNEEFRGTYHYIELRNEDGKAIESLSFSNSADPAAYDRLEQLHTKGQRIADKVDETISEVEVELRRLIGRG